MSDHDPEEGYHEEVRFDPETRSKVTYIQLFHDLKDEGWTEEDILDYWDLDCQSIHSGDSLGDSGFTTSDGTPHSLSSHDSWDHHLSGGPPPPEMDEFTLSESHPSAQRAHSSQLTPEDKAATTIQTAARGKMARETVHSMKMENDESESGDTLRKSMHALAGDKKKSMYHQEDRRLAGDRNKSMYLEDRLYGDRNKSVSRQYSQEYHSGEESYQHSGEEGYISEDLPQRSPSPIALQAQAKHHPVHKHKKGGGGLYMGSKQENQLKSMRDAEDRAARTIQGHFKTQHMKTTMDVMKQDQVPNAFKRQHKVELVGPTPSPWHWKSRTPIGNPRKCIASPASWIMLARQRDLKTGPVSTYPLLPEHLQTDQDADKLAIGNTQTAAEKGIANPGNWQALAKSSPKKKAKPTAPGNDKSFGNFLDAISTGPAPPKSLGDALDQSASSVAGPATTTGQSTGGSDGNFVLIQEEVNRCRDLEMRTAQLREKHHRQLDTIGRQRAESTGLHRLCTLGESGLRCHNCDLQLVNVYRLLGSLGSICTYLTLLVRDQQGEKLPSQQVARQTLSILAEALRTVSDLDPELTRLYEFVSSSLASLRPQNSTSSHVWQGS